VRVCAAILLVVAATASAQSGRQFEVASIKPNVSGTSIRAIGPGPNGRFEGLNVTLRELVAYGFGVDMSRARLQIVGPEWIDQDRFDVDAIIPGGPAPPAEVRPMVAALLADRFKLRAHRETREVPAFSLAMDRDDLRTGPGLRVSTIDCEARRAAARRGGPPPPPQGPPPDPRTVRPICGVRQAPGRFAGDAVSMTQLASALSSFAGRIVLDRTELRGYFDVDLEWTPDPPQTARTADAPDPGLHAGLFTALKEQLGLRLEDARTSVDVVVIDAAERPTAN
jgi:uncharacterized protein (TIGR03435 family)